MKVRKRGFTLIELLVVIAIIAILAAILFPVFARAREKARQTSCLSNCKQMGLAVLMYAQDYGERYPSLMLNLEEPFIYNGFSHHNMLWYMAIEPYHRNVQVFNCPSTAATWRGQYTGDTRYGINAIITRHVNPPTAVMMAEVARPSETLIIADSDWTGTNDYGWSNSYNLTQNPHVSRFIPARHNEGANIVFCDGHAKWYQIPLDPDYTGTPTAGRPALTLNPPGVLWHPDGRW